MTETQSLVHVTMDVDLPLLTERLYSSLLKFLSCLVRLVIQEILVPVGLREVGDCLAWKGHEVPLGRGACRVSRGPQVCLAAKVLL